MRESVRPRIVGSAVLGVLLLVGAAPALTGCSMVEGFIEQQTGGELRLGGPEVPDDFPAEVPLAAVDVINGSAATGAGGERVWNVLIMVSDPAAPTSIAAQLEGAGFASPTGAGTVTDQGGTLTYANGALVVNVLLAKVGDSWTANYTVARAG